MSSSTMRRNPLQAMLVTGSTDPCIKAMGMEHVHVVVSTPFQLFVVSWWIFGISIISIGEGVCVFPHWAVAQNGSIASSEPQHTQPI